MAVDIKVAPDEKLELVQTYITDTNPNSDYFNISELPDTFSGGKNAFLIAGTDKLLANTEIKIQIRDANGNVCYVEYSNGNPEYYEGNSKVVAVYVYPTVTAFGPSTITILGQLKDVPQEWNGLYSVKWTKQVNINPALANTTRVRFYKRPQVTIAELLEPLYTIVSGSKVPSLVTQSFASITVNQLETFAGDVARVKVFRTSAGDIADYELIQDISVEAKNLLTTYALSGSVVGNAGIFGADSLSKVWNTGSLYATLNSTYLNDGLELTGSGNLTYTSSLNLLSSNTYELELDTFFTGSTATNLVAYISGTQNGAIPIVTFSGSVPTKNFGTTTTPFTIPNNEPTASLYFSQSAGNWNIANISLNLSQDTAFSPNEVSFITSMPTVLGNETFNFKFEFYDINNNYVPVAVTQSALFTGGNNNVGGTLILISGSNSASLAAITALSQSVSGTIGIVTGSVSQSFYTASLYSASLQSSSLYISSSLSSSISSSVSTSFSYTSASVNSLSQSVSASLILISSSVSNSAFTVYSASTYLQKFIFTDATGKINRPPTASAAGLYTGDSYLGFYSASQWRTYMDNTGHFYLTGSSGNNFLAWDGSNLQVQGTINIQGGNAATTASLNSATASLLSTINTTSQSLSASLAPNIFTDSNGQVQRPPSVLVGSSQGLFLGSTNLGYYSGSSWQTYMANNGNFYLGGNAGALQWNAATNQLTISGSIQVLGGNAATQTYASSSAFTQANTAYTNASASAYLQASSAYTNAKAIADTIANGTYSGGTLISGQSVISPIIAGNLGYFSGKVTVGNSNPIVLDATTTTRRIYVGAGNFNNTDTGVYLDGSGQFSLKDKLSWNGSSLTISGNITATTLTLSGIKIPATDTSGFATVATTGDKSDVGLSSVTNYGPADQAKYGIESAITIAAGGIAMSGGGYIRGGQTDYNTGTGFFLGYSSGYKFSIGNSSTNYLTWNGAVLQVGGEINANTGTIGGWTINSTQITVPNKVTLDAGTSPGITIFDSSNTPRVLINNNSSLSSLSGAGGATDVPVSAYSANNVSAGGSAINTTYYGTFSTVAGAAYNLTVTFTESNSNTAAIYSQNTNGTLRILIDAIDGSGGVHNIYFNQLGSYTGTTWSWTNLGGINGKTSTSAITGDGSSWTIRVTVQNEAGSTANTLTLPAFKYTYAQNVSKTEIIPGGFQVVNTSTAYLIADRTITDGASTPWMKSAGNWAHNGTLITTSDRNIKSNIIPINFDLTKLNEIDGYSYDKTIDYDGDGNGDITIPTYGVIAQEIETILPNAVSTNANDGIKGVDYNAVTGMLLSAVKQLYLKVVDLEAQISGSK